MESEPNSRVRRAKLDPDDGVALGALTVVLGGILLAITYLYHYWYFVRNPDWACFERAATNDSDTILSEVSWYPGLTCTFQSSTGDLRMAYPGWGATVIAAVAVIIIVAGITVWARSHSRSATS